MPTPVGDIQVDVLEVTDADLADLPADPTDRLHVLSHAWAVATATPVVMRTTVMSDLTVAVAEPGPLVAMKLQSIMNRGAGKEATDLLDVVSLSLDPASGPGVRQQLAAADAQLRQDASRHVALWFEDRIDRSLRLVRTVPEGGEILLDDLRLVGELLQEALL